MKIPQHLLPKDGRFGSGPAKVRPKAIKHLLKHSSLLGTSHRKPPVKELVGRVQSMLTELYRLPEGYEVVLGNGGASLVWDMAAFSLVDERASHAVFGEFSRKFAAATSKAPFLQDSLIAEAPAGTTTLPTGDADVYAWPHNETSTGTMAPVQRLGDGLMLVDGTSAAGGLDLDVSQTDLYYFAPQKNFSSDGGLWIAFASPAAIEQAERVQAKREWVPGILDFNAAVSNSRKQQTMNTPAIATLLLMEAQLKWMLELGGMEAVTKRTRKSTGLLYKWADMHDFSSPFVENPAERSDVVATIDFDASIDVPYLIGVLRDNGIVDIDPYRSLGRNQLRIGCYASVHPDDVEALINVLNYVIERI